MCQGVISVMPKVSSLQKYHPDGFKVTQSPCTHALDPFQSEFAHHRNAICTTFIHYDKNNIIGWAKAKHCKFLDILWFEVEGWTFFKVRKLVSRSTLSPKEYSWPLQTWGKNVIMNTDFFPCQPVCHSLSSDCGKSPIRDQLP